MSARKIASDKQIKKDYKTMSSGEMALKYGVRRVTVCRHLKRLGITRPQAGKNSRNRKRNGEVLKTGYPVIHLPDHPRASVVGYVFKHVLEVEKAMGRQILKTEPIHHVDLDRENYSLGNLHLCESNSDHQKVHRSLDKVVGELIKNGTVKFYGGEYYL